MKKVEDYLQEGIYGKKQIKPDERRKYLGTIRERIVLILTKGQVMKGKGLKELEQLMKEHPKAKLLLNGQLRASYFNKYRKLAKTNQIPCTVVSNKETKTDFALIFTYDDQAIEKADIFLKEIYHDENQSDKEQNKGGVGAFFNKLFKANE